MSATLEPPIQSYLEALELELKQLSGVSPEEALSDAREFLQNKRESLLRAEPGLDDSAVYAHFVETFGPPRIVAAAYAESAGEEGQTYLGYAPGWRICCTKCGRSSPAAKSGIRIGATAWHKYTLGYCHNCRWIRWLRIIKDGNRANLTQLLGMNRTPDDVRQSMHRPWLIVCLILVVVLSISLGKSFFADNDELPAVFQDLPEGWTVQKSFVVPAAQREAIAQRLGGKLDSLTNTVLAKHGQPIQINVVECASDRSADRVQEALLQEKLNRRLVHRSGRTIYEFVARNQDELRLALASRYELHIQPRHVTYRVSFDAAPVKSGDSMMWNRMFNSFLQLAQSESAPEARAEIEELTKHFEFGNQLTLQRYGQGEEETKWSFVPNPAELTKAGGGELSVYRFENLPHKIGVPFVSVTGEITSQTGAFTPTQRKEISSLTKATPHWPVDAPAIRSLAAKITAGSKTRGDKVNALLLWLLPGQNIRFDGPVIGSRYGVEKVVEQRFGHCWDFSDLFVTLCRASDVPCRQVLGWLHGSEGHVWAEVLVDDEGWKQVDPTAAASCGSDYIPFVVTEDGAAPFVYVSDVRIEVIENPDHSS